MRNLLFFVLFFTLILSNCCPDTVCDDPKNPDCPNHDPCLIFEPANASFMVIDSIEGLDCLDGRGRLDIVNRNPDTIFANRDVFFSAENDGETYLWQIGNDPTTYNEKEFSLFFPILDQSYDVDIKLIVCKDPPDECIFQKCDTTSQSVHFISSNNFDSTAFLIVGRYRGVDQDAPLDTFEMNVTLNLPDKMGLVNFPNGCTGQFLSVDVQRKAFILSFTPFICGEACGIGVLQQDLKTLIIDYSIEVDGGERILKKFIGTKIE